MTYVQLKSKNIDTGMGLERLACVVQQVDSIFEVDTIKSLLDCVCDIAGVKYGKEYKTDVSIRVITDHARSAAMMVSEGVVPSNEGRGYVLRRVIRRAARHGRLLGIDGLFLSGLAETVINTFKDAYPHMEQKRDYIKKIISIEEEKFNATLDLGMNILEEFIDTVKKKGSDTIDGEMVFKLHDTYGFPIDLTREIAKEHDLKIDEEGFLAEMKKQKEKAREAHFRKESSAWEKELFTGEHKLFATKFIGYTEYEANAVVKYIISDGKLVENAMEGDEIAIIPDVTPFYAESGGQIGDTGIISGENFSMVVTDCKKNSDGKYLHFGKVEQGMVQVGDAVNLKIDIAKRKSTARNHTTTHILHKALKNVLGDHVNQAGSLVTPDRLRFDFTHFTALSPEELEEIERQVNEVILLNYPVYTEEMSIDEAKQKGATALFGEKYEDTVRVVMVDDFSMELCGGTHISATGEAGLIKIVSESSIASGIRRIEALTGTGAIEWYREREKLLNEASLAAKTTPEEISSKIAEMLDELKKTRKELEEIKAKALKNSVNDIIQKAIDVSGIKVLAERMDGLDINELRNTADMLKSKLGSSVVILASGSDGKVSLIISATKDAVEKGIHCGKIIGEAAKAAGGGGGGRPDMAQAGGKDVNGIDKAIEIAQNKVKESLLS